MPDTTDEIHWPRPEDASAVPGAGGTGAVPRALSARQANFALGVFLLAYVLSFVDRQILALMVDPIRRDLGLSDVQLGLIQGFAFAILYAVMGLPFGLLADRVSRKRIIACGVIAWSLATAACGLARGFGTLFAARIGVGVGEAALSPAAHSFLASAFPREKLGRTMAIYSLGVTGGSGAALIIGGAVIELVTHAGGVTLPLLGELRAWQAAFLVVAAPGVLVMLLALATREPPRIVDPATGSHAVPVAEAMRFLWRNRRTFLGIYLTAAFFGIYGSSQSAWYPALLMRQFGMSAGEAGTLLGTSFILCGSGGMVTGGLVADYLTRRGHYDANLKVIAATGLAVLVPAALTPVMTDLTWFVVLLVPSQFLFYMFFGCSIAAGQVASVPATRGTSSALYLLTTSMIGMSIGSVAAPLANAWLFGNVGLGPALAVVGVSGCAAATAMTFWAMRPYGRLVEANARALEPGGTTRET